MISLEAFNHQEILQNIDVLRKRFYGCTMTSDFASYASLEDMQDRLHTAQFRLCIKGFNFEGLFQEGQEDRLYVFLCGTLGLRGDI